MKKKMSILISLILISSCGIENDERCFNRAQAVIMCLDKEFKEHPEEWRLEYQKQYCEQRFPSEACYYEGDI